MTEKPSADGSVEFAGNQVLIWIPKALLVLSREQFIQALKRGKAYRRAQQQAQRVKEEKACG